MIEVLNQHTLILKSLFESYLYLVPSRNVDGLSRYSLRSDGMCQTVSATLFVRWVWQSAERGLKSRIDQQENNKLIALTTSKIEFSKKCSWGTFLTFFYNNSGAFLQAKDVFFYLYLIFELTNELANVVGVFSINPDMYFRWRGNYF